MINFGDIQMLKNTAGKLKGKNDDELTDEIKKLKAVMGGDDEKIKKQIESVKPLREMLDEEQKNKFDLIIKVLLEE